jgi:alpha-tubulin suppressor-like RCC1 family protein
MRRECCRLAAAWPGTREAPRCLALKWDGTALAWGSNGSGQLGNGTTSDPAGPVQVTGLANATQVAAGGRFSLAVHTVPGHLGS